MVLQSRDIHICGRAGTLIRRKGAMKMAKSQKEAAGSKRGIFKVMSNYWELYLLLLPVLIWFVVFSYVPMGGLIIAFQKYSPIKGIIDSEWVGWANFVPFPS